MLQIATPKKLTGEGIKFLKKIHWGSLNHASVYGKSLNYRLKKCHPTSSREPSMSPMINPLSKFVKQALPEKPRLSTHHNGDPQVSHRERCNLKSQDISNPSLNRLRSVEEKNRGFVVINFLPRDSQISIQGEPKGFSFPNPSSPSKGSIINKLEVRKSGQTISPLPSLNQILGNMKLKKSTKSFSHNDKQIRRDGIALTKTSGSPKKLRRFTIKKDREGRSSNTTENPLNPLLTEAKS